MTQSAVRIGMSLKPRYLAGDADAVETPFYGHVDAFLKTLREAGVSSVELRAINPGTDTQQALAAVGRVVDAGLTPTIHGALPPENLGEDWQAGVPALIAVMNRLRDAHAPNTPITVHAYAKPAGDPASLAADTSARLAQMTDWIEREQMPCTLALELNREKKPPVDPSVTYDGVSTMVQNASRKRLGICWDFGHTWSNVMLQGLAPDAPAAFAAAVIHTHIHDLNAAGTTHWPLTEKQLPLARFVAALKNAGYCGVWNLELSPERFGVEGAGKERALASIGLLRDCVCAAN